MEMDFGVLEFRLQLLPHDGQEVGFMIRGLGESLGDFAVVERVAEPGHNDVRTRRKLITIQNHL